MHCNANITILFNAENFDFISLFLVARATFKANIFVNERTTVPNITFNIIDHQIFSNSLYCSQYMHWIWYLKKHFWTVSKKRWWEIDIHGCYSLVMTTFAPTCVCKSNRRIWRHNANTCVCVTSQINCGDVTMLSQKISYLATMANWTINKFF